MQPREEDSGQYSCHRENQFGEAWKNYTLIVKNGKHETCTIWGFIDLVKSERER